MLSYKFSIVLFHLEPLQNFGYEVVEEFVLLSHTDFDKYDLLVNCSLGGFGCISFC